jgi:hypothetical protein
MAVDDWAALAMRPDLEDHPNQAEEDEEEWEREDAKEEEDNDDDNDDDEEDDDDYYEVQDERRRNKIIQTKPRTPWILKVVIPSGDNNYDTASVYVDPNMTTARLGQSVFQAVSSDYLSNERGSNILVGLFANDRIFYSLDCILAMKSTDAERRLFSITKPIKKRKVIAPPQDHLSRNLYAAAIFLFLSILVVYGRFWSNLIYSIVSIIPTDLPSMWMMITYFCDWPARELYRYGPSAIGWEGRDMIDICTLMNRRFFNGLGGGRSEFDDRDYWSRNMETCDTMYAMKEESFVRMCRPIWYLTLMSLCFVIVKQLVVAAASYDKKPKTNPTDRAILKTYYALQNLFGEHQKQVGLPKSGR